MSNCITVSRLLCGVIDYAKAVLPRESQSKLSCRLQDVVNYHVDMLEGIIFQHCLLGIGAPRSLHHVLFCFVFSWSKFCVREGFFFFPPRVNILCFYLYMKKKTCLNSFISFMAKPRNIFYEFSFF